MLLQYCPGRQGTQEDRSRAPSVAPGPDRTRVLLGVHGRPWAEVAHRTHVSRRHTYLLEKRILCIFGMNLILYIVVNMILSQWLMKVIYDIDRYSYRHNYSYKSELFTNTPTTLDG